MVSSHAAPVRHDKFESKHLPASLYRILFLTEFSRYTTNEGCGSATRDEASEVSTTREEDREYLAGISHSPNVTSHAGLSAIYEFR